MAKSLSIIVKEVEINSRISKYTEKEYKELIIVDTKGIIYRGSLDKGLTIPNKGDTVNIIYQDINNLGREKTYNSLISLSIDSQLPWGIKDMTKKVEITTATTSEKQYFKIKGTLYYAHVKEKDTKGQFPTNKYKVELSISDTTKDALEQLGVLVKNKDDIKGNYVTLKTDYQPEVFGVDGEKLVDIPLIGNGSQATLTVSTYKNKAPQGGKVCLGFSKIELETFVPFAVEARMLTNE